MSENNCKVFNIYNTSIGNIVMLGFYDETVPYLGMELYNKLNYKWKVIGIGMNRIEQFTSNESCENIKSIWDCNLQSITNAMVLQNNDILFY